MHGKVLQPALLLLQFFIAWFQRKTEEGESREGEKLIAFLSADCSHCKEVAKELNNLDIDTYLILNVDEEEHLEIFLAETNTEFPYHIDHEKKLFEIIERAPPEFYLLSNGGIKGEWNEENFDIEELKSLINDE